MTLAQPRWLRLAGAMAALAIVASACSIAVDTAPEGTGPDSGSAQQRGGTPAPPTPFLTFAGDETTLAAFAGRPVVLNFWASWCPSCVAEMSAAFRPVAADLGHEIAFVGMNIQDERALALDLLEDTGVEWINAEDATGALYAELGGLGMPYTVLISPEGRVLGAHNGPLDEAQLRTLIAETIG